PRAENSPLLRVFERWLFGRKWECRCKWRELAVADRASVSMLHDAGFGVQFGDWHVPTLRGRGEQHLSHTRPWVAQIGPRIRNVRAAAGALLAILPSERAVGCAHDAERQRLNAQLRPVRLPLFGNDHRQRSFHALADFGRAGADESGAVFFDADEEADGGGGIGGGGR